LQQTNVPPCSRWGLSLLHQRINHGGAPLNLIRRSKSPTSCSSCFLSPRSYVREWLKLTRLPALDTIVVRAPHSHSARPSAHFFCNVASNSIWDHANPMISFEPTLLNQGPWCPVTRYDMRTAEVSSLSAVALPSLLALLSQFH
jgi:hypothetical protein